MPNDLDYTTESDDDIIDAISDALCNADGTISAKYIRYCLRQRGLEITRFLVVEPPNAK